MQIHRRIWHPISEARPQSVGRLIEKALLGAGDCVVAGPRSTCEQRCRAEREKKEQQHICETNRQTRTVQRSAHVNEAGD